MLEKLVPGFRPAFASNDYLVQVRAVALGLGAMVLPRAWHPCGPIGVPSSWQRQIAVHLEWLLHEELTCGSPR